MNKQEWLKAGRPKRVTEETVLSALRNADRGGLSTADIATAMQVHPTSLIYLLRGMARRGEIACHGRSPRRYALTPQSPGSVGA